MSPCPARTVQNNNSCRDRGDSSFLLCIASAEVEQNDASLAELVWTGDSRRAVAVALLPPECVLGAQLVDSGSGLLGHSRALSLLGQAGAACDLRAGRGLGTPGRACPAQPAPVSAGEATLCPWRFPTRSGPGEQRTPLCGVLARLQDGRCPGSQLRNPRTCEILQTAGENRMGGGGRLTRWGEVQKVPPKLSQLAARHLAWLAVQAGAWLQLQVTPPPTD